MSMDRVSSAGAASGDRQTVVFRIPRSVDKHTMQGLATKYRKLRLTGLELSPEAFSSTLAAESQLADDVWICRLTNPSLETFVCALAPPDLKDDFPSGEMDITSNALDWIAQVTIRGPISAADFALPPESGQVSSSLAYEQIEERWQILSLYMLPTYRGRGISQKLCQVAITYLQDGCTASSLVQTLLIRTMIKPDNLASIMLFKKLNFTEVGLCTLAEALTANGESLPPDSHDPKYHRRYGIILNLRLSKREPTCDPVKN